MSIITTLGNQECDKGILSSIVFFQAYVGNRKQSSSSGQNVKLGAIQAPERGSEVFR